MTLPIRPGLTVPLPGPLHTHRDRLAELADLGYTDIWSSESDGTDAFTPLTLAAAWEPRLRLGTAVVPAFARSPVCLAQTVAALADAAPGRVALGVGASSTSVVERWHGTEFSQPYKRVRDTVRFLRDVLRGEKVVRSYDTFTVDGFRLGARPEQSPAILVGGVRDAMLRLAGRDADGVIVQWVSVTDVERIAAVVREAAEGADREVVCRILVCPSEDIEVVRRSARRVIAATLTTPAYAAFQQVLGRAGELRAMWDAWRAGDRRAAVAAIPDEVVDDLVVHGSPAQCRAHIQRFFASGVTTSALSIVPLDPDVQHWQAVRALAPGV